MSAELLVKAESTDHEQEDLQDHGSCTAKTTTECSLERLLQIELGSVNDTSHLLRKAWNWKACLDIPICVNPSFDEKGNDEKPSEEP